MLSDRGTLFPLRDFSPMDKRLIGTIFDPIGASAIQPTQACVMMTHAEGCFWSAYSPETF
jgi:hypothetical protein